MCLLIDDKLIQSVELARNSKGQSRAQPAYISRWSRPALVHLALNLKASRLKHKKC